MSPPPHPLATIWNFQLGLAPAGKTISVKNAVALYYYGKADWTKMMPPVKEPVRFKLSTESPRELSLLVFLRIDQTQQHYGEHHNMLYNTTTAK